METTLDLPAPLIHKIESRAAREGREVADLVADLLQAGLDLSVSRGDRPAWFLDEKGLPVIPSYLPPDATPPSFEETQAVIEQANFKEDLARAGLSL